jgi:hypothetical protein
MIRPETCSSEIGLAHGDDRKSVHSAKATGTREYRGLHDVEIIEGTLNLAGQSREISTVGYSTEFSQPRFAA